MRCGAPRASSRSRTRRGAPGDLLFVLVKHEVHNAQGLALTEEHDIVYRAAVKAPTLGADASSLPPEGALAARGGPSPLAAAEPSPPPTPAEKGAAWQREVTPDDVLLFRYSALTFNGHRIHYDRRYVTTVEGYPGLVVHGPLIATLLVDLVRRQAPGAVVERFNFKAVRPTFDLHPFRLNGAPSADGRSVRALGRRPRRLAHHAGDGHPVLNIPDRHDQNPV